MANDLVIFDLDGTLIDSLGDLADAMNAVLEEHGHPVHPLDAYRQFVGDGIEMLVRRALPPGVADESKVPRYVDLMRREYSRRWVATTRPFPGIPELLAALDSRGVYTTVLSNKNDSATRAVVDLLFTDHTFKDVRGERIGVPRKPDPTAALEMISALGKLPEQSIFVGDTAIDMATGKNAGIQTVGVTWGFRDVDELLSHGADHIVHRPIEILEFTEVHNEVVS